MCLDSRRGRARQPEVNVVQGTATLGCILSHMTPIHALFAISYIIFQRKLKSTKLSAPLKSPQNCSCQ